MNLTVTLITTLLFLPLTALRAAERMADESRTNRTWLPATPEKLPQWRGFNLGEKLMLSKGRKPFCEEDFRLIAKLGFNFVRLPMDYRFWIKDGNWEELDEATLKEIDQAVEWGRQYGIHVCLNIHRAPGYCVLKESLPPEKTSLWTDAETQRVCAKHWAMFARRYRGIPNERLSFNLVNEPDPSARPTYPALVRKLVTAIRAEDAERLIISDGLDWGQFPLPELRELRVAQSPHCYTPFDLIMYGYYDQTKRAPQWPRPLLTKDAPADAAKKRGSERPVMQDKAWLWEHCIKPWKEVEAKGTGVMVGEFGISNKLPHDIALRWMEDCLSNWKKAGWGWALYEFRGIWGVLDSKREDVQYEDWEGHKLDRKMLELLQRH
jgi:endoglucanase